MKILIQKTSLQLGINLVLLILIALNQSCNGHISESNADKGSNIDSINSVQSSRNTISDSLKKNKLGNTSAFLDTLRLRQMGISYENIEFRDPNIKWRLKFRDTIPKSEQIRALTYFIVTYTEDNNFDVFFQLDSLQVTLPKGNQIFGFSEFGMYFHSFESLLKPDILLDDYNFDGIIDFSVYNGASGNSNETRDFYIFNPKTKKFNNSIRMNNASFDKSKKLVYQTWNGGGGNEGNATFRFSKDDTLIMIKSVNKEYISGLDAYIRERKSLREDGTYYKSLDTIKRK